VDFAARFGGDEFLVLLPHQTFRQAAIFAERLRRKLSEFSLQEQAGEGLKLSISVGISAHGPTSPKADPQQLLQAADAALYEAKRRGRDRIVVFEQDVQDVPAEPLGQRPQE